MGKIRIRSRYRGRIPQTIAESASGVDTPTVQVTGTGGEEHPNEPAGFIPIAYHGYDVLPGGTSNGDWIQYATDTNGKYGHWWRANSSNLALKTGGGGGPLTDTYLEITFPVGLASGVGPCFFIGWVGTTTVEHAAHDQSELYTMTVLRYRGAAGDGHGADEWGFEPTLNKIFYTPYMTTTRQNHGTFGIRPNPFPGAQPNSVYSTDYRGEARFSQVRLVENPVGSGNQCLDPSGGALAWNENIQSSPALFVNSWMVLETYQKLNTLTCPPTSDGVLKVWMDGILRVHHTNVRYASSLAPLGFYQYRFDPVYGGVNGYTKERVDYLDVAYSYISGKEGP